MSFFNAAKLVAIFSNSAKAVLSSNEDVQITAQLTAHTTRARALAKQVTVELYFEGISRKRFKGVVLPRVKQLVENLARSIEDLRSVKFSEVERCAEKSWKLTATMSVEAWDMLRPELGEVTAPGTLKRIVRKKDEARYVDSDVAIGFDLTFGAP